jgi:hypothetical protein
MIFKIKNIDRNSSCSGSESYRWSRGCSESCSKGRIWSKCWSWMRGINWAPNNFKIYFYSWSRSLNSSRSGSRSE